MPNTMSQEELIDFAKKMIHEGESYFFQDYISNDELNRLPPKLKKVCYEISGGLNSLSYLFAEHGIDIDELEP